MENQVNVENEQPVCPKSWMTQSILVTLFCFLPLGIAAIVNSSRVESLFAQGNYYGALEASNTAHKYVKISFGIGIAIWFICLLMIVLLPVLLIGAMAAA